MKANDAGDVFLWDTELRGFGVRMKPTGTRSFVFAYYAPNLHNVRRRITLGEFGPLTVDQARAQAVALAADVGRGNDPAKAKAEERRTVREETVSLLFSEYLDDGIGRKKPRTLEFYESLGRLHLLPALGSLPVRQVTARHVAELHRDLRDKPITANRVVRLVRSFFYWLARQHYVSGQNPAKHIDWFPETPRERFLTVDEMARLGQALRVAETVGLPPAPEHRYQRKPKPPAEGEPPKKKRERNAGMFSSDLQPANPVTVAALRFLMFTGWRESEALTLRWDSVNLSTGMVTLADTKTGKSVRALPAPALTVVAAQPKIEGSPFVFPGRDPAKPLREIQRLWYAVRSEARLEKVRLHDLRHSVASFAGGRGYSLFLIGKLLGHRDQRSTARYAHLADDMRKAVADDVGSVILEAMSADPKTAKLAAVPLRKRALRGR